LTIAVGRSIGLQIVPAGVVHSGICRLKFISKIFKDDKTYKCGVDGDNKICDRENVGESKNQGFAVGAVRTGKFTHQQI
jgi:hypothetical protein